MSWGEIPFSTHPNQGLVCLCFEAKQALHPPDARHAGGSPWGTCCCLMSAALESHPRETILSSMYILCTDCNVSTLKLNYFLKVHDFILLLHIVGPFISLLKGLFAHDPRHSESFTFSGIWTSQWVYLFSTPWPGKLILPRELLKQLLWEYS